MFNKFMPSNEDPLLRQSQGADEGESQGTNLADLILEKIAAHEAGQAGQIHIQGGGEPQDAVELPAKVVEVYSKYVAFVDLMSLLRADGQNAGLAFYFLGTNQANSLNHSRLFQLFHSGKTFWLLPDRNHGQPTLVMKRPRFSSLRNLTSSSDSWKLSSSNAFVKTYTRPRS